MSHVIEWESKVLRGAGILFERLFWPSYRLYKSTGVASKDKSENDPSRNYATWSAPRNFSCNAVTALYKWEIFSSCKSTLVQRPCPKMRAHRIRMAMSSRQMAMENAVATLPTFRSCLSGYKKDVRFARLFQVKNLRIDLDGDGPMIRFWICVVWSTYRIFSEPSMLGRDTLDQALKQVRVFLTSKSSRCFLNFVVLISWTICISIIKPWEAHPSDWLKWIRF